MLASAPLPLPAPPSSLAMPTARRFKVLRLPHSISHPIDRLALRRLIAAGRVLLLRAAEERARRHLRPHGARSTDQSMDHINHQRTRRGGGGQFSKGPDKHTRRGGRFCKALFVFSTCATCASSQAAPMTVTFYQNLHVRHVRQRTSGANDRYFIVSFTRATRASSRAAPMTVTFLTCATCASSREAPATFTPRPGAPRAPAQEGRQRRPGAPSV